VRGEVAPFRCGGKCHDEGDISRHQEKHGLHLGALERKAVIGCAVGFFLFAIGYLAGVGRHTPIPIARLSVAVHHGHDEDIVLLNRVQDGEREDASQAATDILFQDRPAIR
jgi:hypothetical protein